MPRLNSPNSFPIVAVEKQKLDILIVGQGLAGTALGWQCEAMGLNFQIVESHQLPSASRAAAGMVHPISGKRFVPVPQFDALFATASQLYKEVENALGEQLFFPRQVVRLFQNEAERERWDKRLPQLEGEVISTPSALPRGVTTPHGWASTRTGAYLDVNIFCQASRRFWTQNARYRAEHFTHHEIQIEADQVHWRDASARFVVFCEGLGAQRNPFFDWVAFRPAKGEVLTLDIPYLEEKRFLHGGRWLLPLENGHYKCGATYDWNDLTDQPTEVKKGELLNGLAQWCSLPAEIVEHRAGVRPVIRHSELMLGLHPMKTRLGFFNGLGSKGVLTAPHYARHLLDAIFANKPIEEKVDLRKNC